MDEINSLRKRLARLEETNKDLELVFNAMDDLIFVIDKNNIIIKANDACAKFFHTKKEDIIGKRCYDLVHKLNHPWPGCPYEKTKLDKKPHTEEVDDPNIGMPLLITTSPIFDDKGVMIGAVHAAKNITALKKTEKELQNKIAELERFQKVTVDRELKMKELKQKIAELQSKIIK